MWSGLVMMLSEVVSRRRLKGAWRGARGSGRAGVLWGLGRGILCRFIIPFDDDAVDDAILNSCIEILD